MAGISIKRRVKQIDGNYAVTIGQSFNEFISAKEALNLVCFRADYQALSYCPSFFSLFKCLCCFFAVDLL